MVSDLLFIVVARKIKLTVLLWFFYFGLCCKAYMSSYFGARCRILMLFYYFVGTLLAEYAESWLYLCFVWFRHKCLHPFQLVTVLCAFSAMSFEFKHLINTWLISYRPNGFSSAVVFSVSPCFHKMLLSPQHFTFSPHFSCVVPMETHFPYTL